MERAWVGRWIEPERERITEEPEFSLAAMFGGAPLPPQAPVEERLHPTQLLVDGQLRIEVEVPTGTVAHAKLSRWDGESVLPAGTHIIYGWVCGDARGIYIRKSSRIGERNATRSSFLRCRNVHQPARAQFLCGLVLAVPAHVVDVAVAAQVHISLTHIK